jgi:predicted AAA+ superfamily ATPase
MINYQHSGGVILKRNIWGKLIAWKSDPERKPLLLKGARQVGKTWLMQDAGCQGVK